MAVNANTISTLNGLFKKVYADKIQDLIPSNVVVQRDFDFVPAEKEIGDDYNQPVTLAGEHGYTFDTSGDAFALNDAIPSNTKNASVGGFQYVLRGQLSYAAASRAQNGRNSFIDATQYLVKNMRTSAAKVLEMQLMYGGSSIGKVASVSGDEVTLEASDFAVGVWAGSTNMKIDVYDGTASGSTKQVDTQVVSVDINNRKINVTSGDGSSITAGDFIFYDGAFGNEMSGLHTIASNTGTLFGINAANYELWTGNTFSVNDGNTASNLTFNEVTEAVDLAVGKGLDSGVRVYVNYKSWTDLMNNQNDSLRRVDSSYSSNQIDQGTQRLMFYTHVGPAEIVPSIFVKEGYAYVTNPNEFIRPGSSDVTFQRPGQTDQFFMDLQDNAGYELRAYFDQALFCHAPGHQVVIDNISNG